MGWGDMQEGGMKVSEELEKRWEEVKEYMVEYDIKLGRGEGLFASKKIKHFLKLEVKREGVIWLKYPSKGSEPLSKCERREMYWLRPTAKHTQPKTSVMSLCSLKVR